MKLYKLDSFEEEGITYSRMKWAYKHGLLPEPNIIQRTKYWTEEQAELIREFFKDRKPWTRKEKTNELD